MIAFVLTLGVTDVVNVGVQAWWYRHVVWEALGDFWDGKPWID